MHTEERGWNADVVTIGQTRNFFFRWCHETETSDCRLHVKAKNANAERGKKAINK